MDADRCKWLSIDYSAATDGLSASLSQEILSTLMAGLSFKNQELTNLMLSVLAPHEVHYPKVAGVQLDPVQQRNGQLMGSVLSFPVLCLANMGLFLTVRRRLNAWAPYRQLLKSVLINGDDMLYAGTDEEWALHTELGRRIGLEMSAGKAYLHHAYANVNSTSVNMDLRNPSADPVEVKFLNVGLMVGQHKVQGKVGSDDESSTHRVSTVIDEVVRGSLPGKQADIFKLYLSMHREEIKREVGNRNLFLPKPLGGAGVSLINGIEPNVSRAQHQEALKLVRKAGLVPIVRPLPRGFEVKEQTPKYVDPIHLAPLKEVLEYSLPFAQVGPQEELNPLWPQWGFFLERKE